MGKRIVLFLITNALVIFTVTLIVNVILPFFGIQLPPGYSGLAIFCGIFGMGGAFVSLLISRWMAKRAYKIQLITATHPDPTARQLYHTIDHLAKSRGLPTPEVGIYNSPEPNAFATGPSKKSSLVAFSTGILRKMNQREVEAVAAHEISHIANGDMVTMTLLTGIANALVMFLSRVIARLIDQAMRDDRGGGGLGFIGYYAAVFVLESVFMMLAYIPIAAFSRWREYRADAGAARLTSPQAMASALESLKNAVVNKAEPQNYAMAKISSLKRVSLWATHPPLDARIKRLLQNKG
ncbi:MAG: protease HtpX [Acidobacteria bacterium]|nr:MAG: protease HtpX [Acidobacteriota bacterium]